MLVSYISCRLALREQKLGVHPKAIYLTLKPPLKSISMSILFLSMLLNLLWILIWACKYLGLIIFNIVASHCCMFPCWTCYKSVYLLKFLWNFFQVYFLEVNFLFFAKHKHHSCWSGLNMQALWYNMVKSRSLHVISDF